MFPIVVKDARHGNSLYDEHGKVIHEKLGTGLILDLLKRPNRNKRYRTESDWEVVPIAVSSKGRVVSLMPTAPTEERHPYRILSWLYGLYPYVDMDPLIESCFAAGYEEVSIGPGFYASSFGITCKFSGSEPHIRRWPAVWELVHRFGVYVGCGGFHSAQLVNFVPAGRYGFGTHARKK